MKLKEFIIGGISYTNCNDDNLQNYSQESKELIKEFIIEDLECWNSHESQHL